MQISAERIPRGPPVPLNNLFFIERNGKNCLSEFLVQNIYSKKM